MSYFEELTKAMTWLGEKPDTVFLGQQVRYPGNALYKTLEGVPLSKRIELGIMEDAQMGIAIGMAMAGKVPICIYPRMDFLLLAMNQLVNHLNHYRTAKPVIIRTCVGSKHPLDPGPQHSGCYMRVLEAAAPFINFYELNTRHGELYCGKGETPVIWAYKDAYERGKESKLSSILMEWGDMYD